MPDFRLNSHGALRSVAFRRLAAVNLILTLTTAVFIYAWGRLDTYSPGAQRLVRHLLVQGHLATENVVAAWYSSMLLLSVGLLAIAAHAADGRRRSGPLRFGWLLVAAAFVLLSFDEMGSIHERVGMVSAFGGSADAPMGWVYVLAGPIALVAVFLLAFAWLHVRTSPPAFWQMAAGVALFAANPAFERVEMFLLGAGAQAGARERLAHDMLLVVEEGPLELFGTLCFASAALAYLDSVTGGRFDCHVPRRRMLAAVGGLTLCLAAAVSVSRLVIDRLPPGDTGIAANWFPATAFFLLAAACALRQPAWIPRRYAVAALILSAFFGAGIYGYTDWGIRLFAEMPIAGTIAAGVATITVLRDARS